MLKLLSRVANPAPIIIFIALVLPGLNGCSWFAPGPGIGKTVPWSDLPGWHGDRHAEVWPALIRSCTKLANAEADWRDLCAAAAGLDAPDDQQVRLFFEQWFEPHLLYGKDGDREGLITGYYQPKLYGSFEPDDRFRYPVYRKPTDLLTIDLGALYPELKDRRVRGRIQGNRVVPYYDRERIDADHTLLSGEELLWVDDPFALFFLHIQGSGLIDLPDGRQVGVGYANQNGHPYRSIGAELIRMHQLDPEEVSLFTIRSWLNRHPEQAGQLLNTNASYVFFALQENPRQGAVGSLNVALIPERSIAVDRRIIPLGVPVWLDTVLPESGQTHYRRLVMAQDTGGAIKGPVRADLFWGAGDRAERMAGLMKQPGQLYVLLPKPVVGDPERL